MGRVAFARLATQLSASAWPTNRQQVDLLWPDLKRPNKKYICISYHQINKILLLVTSLLK